MSAETREAAAQALMELIGKGPGTTYPFPQREHLNALAVVDALRADQEAVER